MIKLLPLATILLVSTCFLQACKKNMVEEQYTPIINPVTPDFTTQVNASVNGFITDENGNAVEGASIKGGAITATTDKFGYFKISNAAFAKSAGFVQVKKNGYFTGYRTFLPVEGKETFVRLQLIPKTIAGNVDAATGGTVLTSDGAKITLPANGVVVASNNTAYTGTVNISAHWLNPAEEGKTQLTMPGNLTGVDSTGHLNVLVTYGMLAVELSGSNGELLQMAPGKKASLSFPIPPSISGTAPAAIPLWYFDESKGVWQQEGRAVKNGSNYEGDVSHFTFWNCDVGLPLVNFTMQTVDLNLQPLANVPILVSIINEANSVRTSYTDESGKLTDMVPANSSLTMTIPVPCNQKITFKEIQTSTADIDMGSIKVNMQQFGGIIKGSVSKCNGTPVTDGYVIIAGIAANSIINVQNGSFSAASVICPGSNAAVIAIDREAAQQSNIENITLSSGINIVRDMQACNTSPTELITLVKDGIANNYALPQFLFGGNFYFIDDSTSINAIDLLNGNQQTVQFSFTGSSLPGTYNISNNRFSTSEGTFEFVNGLTVVHIVSYGLVGQFISGYFGGEAHPVGFPGTVNNYQITFNIKRDQ